jgi:signal transduction histidine kinase
MRVTQNKLLKLGFGLALLILVLIGSMFYWTTRNLMHMNELVLNTREVMENLSALLTGIYTGESSARGFVISGDSEYLKVYQNAIADTQIAVQNLEGMINGGPIQIARLETLKARVQDKIDFSNRKIELRRTQGRDAAIDFFLTGRDHALMDDIRSMVSEMKLEEMNLLHKRQTKADLNTKWSTFILVIGFAFSFSVLLAVHYFLNHEITRRRQAEAAAGRLNEDLERRVRERTAELADLNRQLEERNREVEHANRMKSEFLARMSHELRTPLNAIIGFSDLLAEESAGPLSQKQERFISHVRAGARHLLQLINDVLDVSKIEAGKIELNLADFVAEDAIAEVLSVIRPLAESKGIDTNSRVQTDLIIHADRVRFKQILYNLLNNAVKFTPEGGKVDIDAFPETEFVRVCVSDTGAGIPAEEQRAIFEEFHQVGSTTKNANQGTGLGLTITKRLVELHRGAIWVESQPDTGSRFIFTIPLAVAA